MLGCRSLFSQLQAIDARVAGIRAESAIAWRAEAQAVLFHLSRSSSGPVIVSMLGGTGTGKSTMVNRILGHEVCAADFRRTYTAGPVAVGSANPPRGWMVLPFESADRLPARGKNDALTIIAHKHPLLEKITLVDTPDLDGDQPAHPLLSDRAFRWSDAVIFLVSPEKYQMTELAPYYRLARRYSLPVIFVMNKCLTPAMLDDYRAILDLPDAALFAVPRDDAGYEPPAEMNLSALRDALGNISPPTGDQRQSALRVRVNDLLGRLRDQVIDPLRAQRKDADAAVAALRAMETSGAGVDVNPITEQLQRRLQQRSVLYLMGPGRVLDRVRQVPEMLVRLPRTAWDALFGRVQLPPDPSTSPPASRPLPDFHEALVDQFAIVQSRIDDILRASAAGKHWTEDPHGGYAQSRIDPQLAGTIADEELKKLRDWLEKRWNATPRDTVLLLRLLKHLPGGEKLTQWTEAAPYLLAIVVAAHHAFFGHIDLMILGGYTLATWITERLSNEVASRARQTNRTIARRFEQLAHEQLQRSIQWINQRVPATAELDALESAASELQGDPS